jgi:DNA-binding CsgD family transcriptional regulator
MRIPPKSCPETFSPLQTFVLRRKSSSSVGNDTAKEWSFGDKMLQQDVDSMKHAETLADLEQALKHALAGERVSVFNYGAGRIATTSGVVVERYWTTMDPAWLVRYVAKGYQKTDRLVTAAIAGIQPFFFDDVFSIPPQLPEQVEMETMFPYRRGFVVPMHSPFGRFGILSAASDLAEEEWQQTRFEALARVSLLAHTAHQAAEALASRDTIHLTQRERSVLKWAAFGKTSDEIAALLGLTERTVRKHIASCMDKLGASSRVQAVSQALLAGYLTL